MAPQGVRPLGVLSPRPKLPAATSTDAGGTRQAVAPACERDSCRREPRSRLTALISRVVRVADTDLAVDGSAIIIAGDIADPAILTRTFAQDCDAVVHLATVPGGAAEAAPVGFTHDGSADRLVASALATLTSQDSAR